jgi:hypothetical protein
VFVTECVAELLHGMYAGDAKAGEVERAMDIRQRQRCPGAYEHPEGGEAEIGTADGDRVGSRWRDRRRTTNAWTADVAERTPRIGGPQSLPQRPEFSAELGHPDCEPLLVGVDVNRSGAQLGSSIEQRLTVANRLQTGSANRHGNSPRG